MKSPTRWSVLALTLTLWGCGYNYANPSGPRFGAPVPPSAAPPVSDHVLLVVTFNVKEGKRVESALEVIERSDELRDADIILLQEMDAAGTRRMAEALKMGWAYYPVTVRHGRDFGNAVLSRWPIESDEKLLLPHRSWFGKTRRAACVATVRVEGRGVRVYSVHLATPLNQSGADRADQLKAVLDDAAPHPRVVIGGDLNSASIAELALWSGYTWLTPRGPRTTWFARADHIVVKGLLPTATDVSGTVRDNRGSSDHLPVWARMEIH